MRPNPKAPSTTRHIRVAAALAASAAGIALAIGHGCDRPSTTAPEPPGGGQAFVLNYQVFASQIDTILTARGCDDLSCHGGGIRGTFALSPAGDNDIAFDYSQSGMQVNGADPAASPLLMKPLAPGAGGSEHGGGTAFTSSDDPDYQTLLAWIQTGEYR
jgi:hypothetical protein